MKVLVWFLALFAASLLGGFFIIISDRPEPEPPIESANAVAAEESHFPPGTGIEAFRALCAELGMVLGPVRVTGNWRGNARLEISCLPPEDK